VQVAELAVEDLDAFVDLQRQPDRPPTIEQRREVRSRRRDGFSMPMS
jgi:hypothetical protein